MKIALFLISAIFGAIVYILGASLFTRALVDPNLSLQIGSIELEPTGFDGELKLYAVAHQPVDLGFDGSGALYLLNQTGSIVKKGINQAEHSKFHQVERPNFIPAAGCSAVAFHPDFLNKKNRGFGKFYLALAEKKGSGKTAFRCEEPDHQEVVVEFTTRDPLASRFEGSIREVLRIDVPAKLDGNALTDLTFDHRGLLYIGIADSLAPEKSSASNLESIHGKVLRINPLEDNQKKRPYGVPRSNPFFLVSNSLPELWSYGLRKPHSVSYDPFREWICISDTGQDLLEEINVSAFGAEFFGWNLSEGSYFYPLSDIHATGEGIVSPQIEYARGRGVGKNVGSVIYRGERFPYLDGKAVFADETGRLLAATVEPDKTTNKLHILKPGGDLTGNVISLKEGPSGELFFFCDTGEIFELSKARRAQAGGLSTRALLARVE